MYRGQPADAVAVLFVMHLAIAVVTYNLLVRLAPTVPRHAKPAVNREHWLEATEFEDAISACNLPRRQPRARR